MDDYKNAGFPQGWAYAFSDLIREDVKALANKYDTYIQFDGMRFNNEGSRVLTFIFNANNPPCRGLCGELKMINDAYLKCAKHICFKCGKPDVFRVNDVPVCRECFKGDTYEYMQGIDDIRTMSSKLKLEDRVISITPIASRIREAFYKRVVDDTE